LNNGPPSVESEYACQTFSCIVSWKTAKTTKINAIPATACRSTGDKENIADELELLQSRLEKAVLGEYFVVKQPGG